MPEIREWIHFDLRCYTCDRDIFLSERFEPAKVSRRKGEGLLKYCSNDCASGTPPLSEEIVLTFKLLLDETALGVKGYLDWIGTLPVADAMLEGAEGWGGISGLRSIQWRRRRLAELELVLDVYSVA